MTDETEEPQRRVSWSSSLQMMGLAVLTIGAAVVVWIGISTPRGPATNPFDSGFLPATPIPLRGAHAEGDPGAGVVVLEFADFECPFCRTFHSRIYPELRTKYIVTGKVRFVFRHYPLDSLHPLAFEAAVASECATTDTAFWTLHDELLSIPQLDQHAIDSVMASSLVWQPCPRDQAELKVRADAANARAYRIAATPTFFIGRATKDQELTVTSVVFGLKPLSQFDQAINQAIHGK